MSLYERLRPASEAAPWVCAAVKELEADLAFKEEMLFGALALQSKLKEALHSISLASQNSSSTKDECGKIARGALALNRKGVME